MPLTPEQIEADIRSVKRTCRGHLLIDTGDREVLVERWNAIKDAWDFPAGICFKNSLEDEMKTGRVDIAEHDWTNLFQRIAGIIFSYTEDCGYNFNDIIMSNPIDGKNYEYVCPKCGQTGSYQAATYEGL